MEHASHGLARRYLADRPPFAEHELLGKVSLILRDGSGNGNGKSVAPRQRLSLPELVVSVLAQRSVMATRAIVCLRQSWRQARRA